LSNVSRREPNPNHDTLVPHILKGPYDENGLDIEFYKEAIKRFDDDDAFPALFNSAMVKISTKLSTMSMEDEYKPYVQV
jgi:ubiquitin conjugation factor E4 B